MATLIEVMEALSSSTSEVEDVGECVFLNISICCEAQTFVYWLVRTYIFLHSVSNLRWHLPI